MTNRYKVKTEITKIISLSALIFISISARAQSHESESLNVIISSFGYTFIPAGAEPESEEEDGFIVPTVGLDYFREVGEKWEVGLMTDLELGHYLIFDKDLDRENAFLIVATAQYKFLDNWAAIGGVGVEFEKNENLKILRVGVERSFQLGKGWKLGIPLVLDYKKGYDTWALAVSFGKKF